MPLFIDWNGYRAYFEAEAERLIGQPVTIAGDIEARILPVPSITLNAVSVGQADGEEMLTVERFFAQVELLSLLTGDFAISELELDRPWLKIAIDDDGRVDWFETPPLAAGLDSATASVEDVTITNGAIEVVDGSTGAAFQLVGINTTLLEAASLQGPWRIEGELACQAVVFCGEDGLPVQFRFSTSRPDEAGLVRLTASLETTATEMAGTLFTEGMLDFAERSVSYDGTFRFDKLAEAAGPPPAEDEAAAAPGIEWQLAGAFSLDNSGVALSEFTFIPDAATVVIDGSGSLSFGSNARFEANVTTRQIDLDTLIGGGPGEPVAVADAVAEIFNGLRDTARPPVGGELHVNIPSVIVSRTILQDVDFTLVANAEADSWSIADLVLDLPGETALELGGRLSIGEVFGFTGSVRLASADPAVFAAWWRGPDAPRSRLAPFDVGMQVDVAPGRIDVSDLNLGIGNSTAGGAFTWTDAMEEGGVRRLEADITAETFDLDQLAALGQLLFGDEITASDVVADEYVVRLNADQLIRGDLILADVDIDAALGNDTLIVNAFRVGDLGGAEITVTEGRIDRLSGTMQGGLTATLVADDLDGLAALADTLAPDSPFARWLATAAPHLAAASLTLSVAAPAPEGFDIGAFLTGTLGATTVNARAFLTGSLDAWQDDPMRLELDIDSPDTALLVRQLGLSLAAEPPAEPTSIFVSLDGVPSAGMAAAAQVTTVGGARIDSAGTATLTDGALAFEGGTNVTATDIEPLLAVFFPDWPGLGAGTSVSLTTEVEAGDGETHVAIAPTSSIALQRVEGDLTLTTANGTQGLNGRLALEEADLGWLLSLPGGSSLLPAAGDQPWSAQPFAGAPFGALRGEIAMTVARLTIGAGLDIGEAILDLSLRPDGGALGISQGVLAGGSVEGQVNLTVADSAASLTGLLTLDDVSIEPLVWLVNGAPVASGEMDANLSISGTGRSPAGLVAALSGSGTLTIDDGAISAMNPDAFRLVLETVATEEGFDTADLEGLFVFQLDAGPLLFEEAVVPVDIASGLAVFGRTAIDGEGATASARATIDLNSLTLNSNWELAAKLDGDAAIGGLAPEVRIAFTGPLAAPARDVSVTPLMTYLGTLRVLESERLLAASLEMEMFRRLIARQTADRAAAAAEPAVEPVVPPEPAAEPEPELEPEPAPLLIPLSR